jgi:organic radical activating enzyme
MEIDLIPGRSNLACTIMVPWSCKFNCPFCTVKADYKKTEPNIDKVLQSIRSLGNSILFNSGMIKEFVITGGEPFDQPNVLKSIIDVVSKYKLPIYINTAFPLVPMLNDKSVCKDILSTVNGVNVSRHLTNTFPVDSDTDENVMLGGGWNDFVSKEKVRVNSVVTEKDMTEDLPDRIKKFVNHFLAFCNRIIFRADYTKIKTVEELKTLNDPFLKILLGLYDYTMSTGCAVCNDDAFHHVSYHRGVYKTLIQIINNTYLVHDIIIRHNGEIWPDWVRPDDSVMKGFFLYLSDKHEFRSVFSKELKNKIILRSAANKLREISIPVKSTPLTPKKKTSTIYTNYCGSSGCGLSSGCSASVSSTSCGYHGC